MCYRAARCKRPARLFLLYHVFASKIITMHKCMKGDGHLCVRDVLCLDMGEEVLEKELPSEPTGHGEIATGSVSSFSPF